MRVKRRGVLRQAFSAKLERALTLRKELLSAAGPLRVIRTRGHSNTGVVGVTEGCLHTPRVQRDCFMVSTSHGGRHTLRRVYYGPQCRTRDEAFALACEMREEHTR